MALKTTPWGGLQCHIVIRDYKIKGSQGAIQWALSGTRGPCGGLDVERE